MCRRTPVWALVSTLTFTHVMACSSKSSKAFIPTDGGGQAGAPTTGGSSGSGGSSGAGGGGGSGGGGVGGTGGNDAGCGDVLTDAQNCGQCGNVCAAGEDCAFGVCGGGEIIDAAGGTHACVLTKAGRLFCFGANQYGQLGVPMSGNVTCGPQQWPCRPEAVLVPDPTDVVDVAAGQDFTCAVRQTGRVVCWGRNEYGQLGHDPSLDDNCGEPCGTVPVEVVGVSDAVGIAAGRWHACAWTSAGAAYCWGRNNEGVVGSGTLTEIEPAAKPVVGLSSGVTEIAMMLGGVNHACALRDDKHVVCWGQNGHAQLGRAPGTGGDVAGLTGYCNPTPTEVAGVTGVVDVFLGEGVSCVVKDDESVWCWGSDGQGLLGSFTGTNTPAAVVVPPTLAGSAYRGHVCVRSSLSDVWCWGQNYFGQLGDGTTTGGYNGHACLCKPPAQISTLKVRQLVVADDFALAVKFDGTVWAWGYSGSGALGHVPETTGDVVCQDGNPCNPTPQQILGLP